MQAVRPDVAGACAMTGGEVTGGEVIDRERAGVDDRGTISDPDELRAQLAHADDMFHRLFLSACDQCRAGFEGITSGAPVPAPVLPPQSEPYGDCIATHLAVIIERADPRVLITAEMLQIFPQATFLAADVVRVGQTADGTDVLYRITGWDARERALIGERIVP